MVTKVYLVRHAEAMGNVLEVFQGHTDAELSEKGWKQLDCLAERFKYIDFDGLYSSPLKRTIATANAVNHYHNHEIITDSELIEIDGGDWEGVSWKDIPTRFSKEYDVWISDMQNFKITNGESMAQVYERMKNAVDRIVKANAGKTIVIVSHGCAIRNYLCYASGLGLCAINDMGWSDNTAVSFIEYDDNFKPSLIYKNDFEHLGMELSTLANSAWCKSDGDNNYVMNGAYYKK
ncbi:MAG TPA: histidine phosphatase family protein [Clostridia bacterium]|nr:histidine phosphatase family protein [Clostridia bacterium]